MKTIKDINSETKTRLLTVIENHSSLFDLMWAQSIRKTETNDEALHTLKEYNHYSEALQNLEAFCTGDNIEIKESELLDIADTFQDITIFYQDDERVTVEINCFSKTLISLTK